MIRLPRSSYCDAKFEAPNQSKPLRMLDRFRGRYEQYSKDSLVAFPVRNDCARFSLPSESVQSVSSISWSRTGENIGSSVPARSKHSA